MENPSIATDSATWAGADAAARVLSGGRSPPDDDRAAERPGWRANLAQSAPLVFTGAAFGGFAVYLRAWGSGGVRGALPLWFLFAGFAAIATAGAIAMVLLADPRRGDEEAAAGSSEELVTVPKYEWEDLRARLGLLAEPPVIDPRASAVGEASAEETEGDRSSEADAAARFDADSEAVSLLGKGERAGGGETESSEALEGAAALPEPAARSVDVTHRMDEFIREIESALARPADRDAPAGKERRPDRRAQRRSREGANADGTPENAGD
jgi:hypothetical protein